MAHPVRITFIFILIIRASNAVEGQGVTEGINWLSEIIKRKKK